MRPAIAALLPWVVVLAACTTDPAAPVDSQARANAATLAACRERGEEIYERQNRGSIYSISNRDAPYSANYMPELVDRGLSQRFGYDKTVRDCVRNTGTQTDRNGTVQPTPPGTAPAPGATKP